MKKKRRLKWWVKNTIALIITIIVGFVSMYGTLLLYFSRLK